MFGMTACALPCFGVLADGVDTVTPQELRSVVQRTQTYRYKVVERNQIRTLVQNLANEQPGFVRLWALYRYL